MTSVMSLFCAACKKIQLMNARMVLSLLLLPLWHGKHSMLMDGCCFVSFSTNIISQFPSKFICFIILLLNRFFFIIFRIKHVLMRLFFNARWTINKYYTLKCSSADKLGKKVWRVRTCTCTKFNVIWSEGLLSHYHIIIIVITTEPTTGYMCLFC